MDALKLLRLMSVVLLVAGGVRCDRGTPAAPENTLTGEILIEVEPAYPELTSPSAAKIPVVKGRLRISGLGMATRDTALQVGVDRHLKARLAGIPVGIRKVELYLLGASDDTLWQGADDAVNVGANRVEVVKLEMRRVGEKAPEVDFAVTPNLDRVGRPFSFRAIVIDRHDSEDSLRVRWDFDGDGTYDTDWSVAKDITRPYAVVGDYQVVVQVQNKNGKFNTNTNTPAYMPKLVQVIDLMALAGRDSAVFASLAEPIRLDGRGSQGLPKALNDSLVYHWKHLVNYPLAVKVSIENTFNSNNSRDAGLIKFTPSEGAALYAFALTLEYAGIFSEPDTLLMQVHSRLPTASVNMPNGVRVGETVHLTGVGADADDPTGVSLVYRWSGAQAGLLSDLTSAAPTFVPDEDGTYTFELEVGDSDPQWSAPVPVVVVVGARNQVPVADAGNDTAGVTGADLVLDGTRSTDPDAVAQLDLVYRWVSLDGPVLNDLASPRPTFRPSDPGTYHFVLAVNDGTEDSLPDTVAVIVGLANRAPVAHAGADTSGQVGAEVSLDGSLSSDPDGTTGLQYRWTALDGGGLTSQTQAKVGFSSADPGEYRISLVVSDGMLESNPDTVQVHLKDRPRLLFAAKESVDGDFEIYSASMDGLDRIKLTASPGDDNRPAASVDGQTIVFTSDRLSSKDVWTDNTVPDIWQMKTNGTDPIKLVDTATWPALSGEGRLAYCRNSGLLSVDPDPPDPAVYLFVLEPDGSEGEPLDAAGSKSRNFHPSWSPDGRQLVVARWEEDFGWDLFIWELDGGGLTQLVTAPDSDESEPSWSPDGTQIAFVSDQDGEKNIYVVGAGGGNPTKLAREPGVDHVSPAWSPDGSLIAYVRQEFDGQPDIYIMNAGGSNPHLAIENAQDPAWLQSR